MGNRNRYARPAKYVCCLCLTALLLCLSVFAVVPENGNNTLLPGADRTAGMTDADGRGTTARSHGNSGRSSDRNSVMNAVTDAADAVGDAVSDAGNAVGNAIGNVGESAGEIVSDAGNAVGDAANAAGDAVDGTDRGNGVIGNTEIGAQTEQSAGNAVPYDNSAADVTPGNAGAAGSVTAQNNRGGFNWILILILVAAAAAIFFLLLMPRRSREM